MHQTDIAQYVYEAHMISVQTLFRLQNQKLTLNLPSRGWSFYLQCKAQKTGMVLIRERQYHKLTHLLSCHAYAIGERPLLLTTHQRLLQRTSLYQIYNWLDQVWYYQDCPSAFSLTEMQIWAPTTIVLQPQMIHRQNQLLRSWSWAYKFEITLNPIVPNAPFFYPLKTECKSVVA